MNVKINSESALAAAQDIVSVIENMGASMSALQDKINKFIPAELETEWALNFKSEWETHFSSDVPATFEELKTSATNIQLVVNEMMTYSKGQ